MGGGCSLVPIFYLSLISLILLGASQIFIAMFSCKNLLVLLLCLSLGCSKSDDAPPPSNGGGGGGNGGGGGGNGGGGQTGDTFTTYIIKAGNNFCENNVYPLSEIKILKFKAILDSTCIYTNVNPDNQADINKLYGFADDSAFHQISSARFGWNWMDGQMHIHAYCYANAVRSYKELGTVLLNKEIECSLEVLPGKYIFTLNGKRDTMLRSSQDTVASGYKLLPYFGGDEPAPQDIKIKIKEIK